MIRHRSRVDDFLANSLHTAWEIKLSGHDACRIVVPSGARADELLNQIETRFPDRVVQFLRPVADTTWSVES